LRSDGVQQNQNVGDGYRYGLDLSLDHQVSDKLAFGGSLSLLRTHVSNPSIPTLHQTGFPDAKLFLYANIRPTDRLTIRPSVEYSDGNWSSSSGSYFQLGSYTLANLSADYAVNDRVTFSVGVNNMFDEDYATVYGYPSQGRSFFINAKATF